MIYDRDKGGMMDMFDNVLPHRFIGYIYPRHVVDTLPYEMYRLLPDRVMMVMCPVSLKKFTREDVDRALTPLDQYVKMLVGRKVNVVVHGGVPLTLFQGCAEHDEMLAKIHKSTGLPATSTTEQIVDACKHLGMKKVAIGNKWKPGMNQSLAKYFERKGVGVVGANCLDMELELYENMDFGEHTDLVYEIGKKALKDNPDADGLYLGGGSMVSYPVVDVLEKEFGKPVVLNCAALAWGLSRMLGVWKPKQGLGRLMASD
jgi:maleate cis-trans isomerase